MRKILGVAAAVAVMLLPIGGSAAAPSGLVFPPAGPGPRQPTALGNEPHNCWKWKLDTVWEYRNVTPAPPGYYPEESRTVTHVLLWCPSTGYTIRRVWSPWKTPQPDGTLG